MKDIKRTGDLLCIYLNLPNVKPGRSDFHVYQPPSKSSGLQFPLMLNVHFVHKAPLMCGPKVEPIRSHSHVSEENTLSVLERIVSYRGDIFKLPSDNDPAADALLTAEQL